MQDYSMLKWIFWYSIYIYFDDPRTPRYCRHLLETRISFNFICTNYFSRVTEVTRSVGRPAKHPIPSRASSRHSTSTNCTVFLHTYFPVDSHQSIYLDRRLFVHFSAAHRSNELWSEPSQAKTAKYRERKRNIAVGSYFSACNWTDWLNDWLADTNCYPHGTFHNS